MGSVFWFSVYLPNPGSKDPKKYTDELFATLTKNLDEIRSRKGQALIGMDSNCPFKKKGVYPRGSGTANSKLIETLVAGGCEF